MTSRILVIIGTPLPATLNHALANAYAQAARRSGAHVRLIDLAGDPIPDHPRSRDQLRTPRNSEDLPLDPCVERYLGDVLWANHLVFFFPQWWGTMPAALKAFIDRVFLAGTAFSYRERSSLPNRFLTGRTARIVMTMDSPRWWNRFAYHGAAETSLRTATLGYCGIRTVGVSRLSPVRFTDDGVRKRWIERVATLGRHDAHAVGRAARRHRGRNRASV